MKESSVTHVRLHVDEYHNRMTEKFGVTQKPNYPIKRIKQQDDGYLVAVEKNRVAVNHLAEFRNLASHLKNLIHFL